MSQLQGLMQVLGSVTVQTLEEIDRAIDAAETELRKLRGARSAVAAALGVQEHDAEPAMAEEEAAKTGTPKYKRGESTRRVVMAIATAGKAMSAKEIAQNTGTNGPTAWAAIHRGIDAGLYQRQPDNKFTLTAKGRELAEKYRSEEPAAEDTPRPDADEPDT